MRWPERIGRRIKLRDLNILLEVAHWGSMAKAARHLAISTPVVSKAISDLEHVVGVRLLDRTAQGIEATIYGRTLLKWSVAAFDDLKQAVKEIEFLADPTEGELRIGCTEVIASGIMRPIIKELAQQHPRIRIHVLHVPQVTAPDVLFRPLRDRMVDIMVGRVPKPLNEDDLNCEELFLDRMLVVAGLRSKWARRRNIDLPDLVDEPWVLPSLDTPIGSHLVEAFGALGLRAPRTNIVSTFVQLRSDLLADGLCLTVLPESMLRFGRTSSFKALPIKLPAPAPGPVALVTLKNRTLSPLVTIFANLARAVAKPLANSR